MIVLPPTLLSYYCLTIGQLVGGKDRCSLSKALNCSHTESSRRRSTLKECEGGSNPDMD